MFGNDNIILEMSLDSYEPGDIKDTKERLAQQMQCAPTEIGIRITGVKGGKGNKGSSLHFSLIDFNTIKNVIK